MCGGNLFPYGVDFYFSMSVRGRITMEQLEAVSIYENVMSVYRKHTHTQVELAEMLNIPIDAVAWCTQNAGYWHCKAKDGERGVYYADDPKFMELQRILDGQK